MENYTYGNVIHINPPVEREIVASAFNGCFKEEILRVKLEERVFFTLKEYLSFFQRAILNSLNENIGHKVILNVKATLESEDQKKIIILKSKPNIIYKLNDKKILNNLNLGVLNDFNSFIEEEESGWAFVGFGEVHLNYAKHEPIKGCCGENKLPDWIKNEHSVVFIDSKDEKCFYWCILRHFNPTTEDLKKIDPNKYANFNGINFPTTVEDLNKFSKNNPHIRLVVFGVDNENKRTPVIFEKNKTGEITINLLLFEGHYYLITDLSRLILCQLSKKVFLF